MRKLVFASILFSITALTTAQTPEAQKENKEVTENIKKEKRELGSFNKVKAGKGINVTLVESKTEFVEIHIKNGEPSDVVAELSGKTLSLKMRTRLYKGMAVQVYVNYKELVDIYAGTGSSIDCDGAILTDRILLKAGSDASIEVELYAKTLEASLSASRIDISGEVDFQEVKATTGASYNADQLLSKEALIKTNTGAHAIVNVKEKLTGSAATGSQIDYSGNPPKVEKSMSMGGKVEPVN